MSSVPIKLSNVPLRAVLRLAAWVLLAAVLGFPTPANAGNRALLGADFQNSQIAPPPLPRLLVKFKSGFAQEVESSLTLPALELRQPSPRIQAWLETNRLQNVRPLYPAALRQKIESSRSHRQMAERARDRFPQRAQRAPRNVAPPEILRTYILDAPALSLAELRAALERVRADAEVEFAQLDQIAQAQFMPNDPYFSSRGSWGQAFDDLYGVKIISCPAAWDTANGTGVLVAVVDTGIDYRHRDITNRMWINPDEIPDNGVDDDQNGFVDDVRGWDFIGASYNDPQPDNDPADPLVGHGTHVAGTIAAEGNNNRGIIGVAWGARVMAVRGLDDAGFGADSALANAIIYAADNGADVINASWGAKGNSPAIEDAVNYAVSLGVVFVAAAGNASIGNAPGDVADSYPGNLAAAISVSAFTPNDGIAEFSNFGYGLDVAAPGVEVLSLRATNTNLGRALDEEYTRLDGTSMAAAHVSGAAALVLSLHPGYAPEEVRQVLRRSADRVMPGIFDPYSGYGRIDASNALAFGPVLQSRIFSPPKNFLATPQVAVSGVATGTNFASYTLDFGSGDEPSMWTVLTESNSPVDHAALGTLKTWGLADGRYAIRLRTFDQSGGVFEDHVHIVVDYTFITSPVPPVVPSVATVHKPGVNLPIIGTARGPGFRNFRVEWARGFNANLGFTNTGITLAGGGSKPVTNGLLANWNSAVVTQADYYTIRLRMTTATLTNEARSEVYFEPDLYSTNWPRWLDEAPQYGSSVQLARDSAGSNYFTLANEKYLSSGLPSRLWRFPLDGSSVTTFAIDRTFLQPAVGNLDENPGDETVVPERNDVRIFRPDGSSFVPALPQPASFRYTLPTLADLDGDGTSEILAWGSVDSNVTAWIYAWKGNGQLFSTNYPIGPFPDYGVIPPNRFLPVDVDADGKPEFVVVVGDTSSSFSLHMFTANGESANWPTHQFNGTFWQLAAGDLDNDGSPEIVLAYSDENATNWLHTFTASGSPRPGWPVRLQGETPLRAIVADLDRDGQSELIAVAKATLDVLRADGSHFPTLWPVIGDGFQGFGSPVVGDVDGDGVAEILVTRENVVRLPSGVSYRTPTLQAYQTNGQVARSWRLLGANGNQPTGDGNVVFGDFDGDGKVDLTVNYMLISGGGSSGNLIEGVLTVLRVNAPYRPHLRDWPVNFHDGRNSAAGFVPARLRAAVAGSNLLLSWPRQPEPASLRASDKLSEGIWSNVLTSIVSSNGMNTVTVPATNSHRWYRLLYP